MRVSFLIDGFNVYHSLADVERRFKTKVKWLNLRALCESYLSAMGKEAAGKDFYYFSAHASHMVARDPNIVNRHQSYIRALKSVGVQVQLGKFKEKRVKCHHCGQDFKKYEEKETDVSIAVKIFELFHKNECDHIVLLTGDTDLLPAIRTAKDIYGKKVSVLFPYGRYNAAFDGFVDQQFKIKDNTYAKFQFPETLQFEGKTIHKPASW